MYTPIPGYKKFLVFYMPPNMSYLYSDYTATERFHHLLLVFQYTSALNRVRWNTPVLSSLILIFLSHSLISYCR